MLFRSPVMDYRNNAIGIDKVSAMDVNKTIQRSTTKAIAMHGLGLSLWTGEDVPELTTTAPDKKVATAPASKSKIEVGDSNWAKVESYINDNKHLGLKKICDSIGRKYTISTDVKKHINEMIQA